MDVTTTGDQIPDLDLMGKVLENRYRVTERLGGGGMGAVYLARDERLGRQVVVKVPHLTFLAEPGFKERFHLEIESLIRLDHPAIVKVYDAGDVNGVPYAILQFLDGGDLKNRLDQKGGRLTASEVLQWLPAMAQALDFLHSQETIHRDVKPGNVLFDGDGNAYLADFGVAKALGARDTGLTQTGATPGSPAYMAPEVVTGTKLTAAYDQYALGTVVYQSLAGTFPHEGETPIKVLFKKANHPPQPIQELVPGLKPGLAAVVMQAIDQDPEARYACCAQYAEAFTLAIDESGTRTTFEPDVGGQTLVAPGLKPQTEAKPRGAAGGGRKVAALGTLALAVILVAVWFFFGRDPGTPREDNAQQLAEHQNEQQQRPEDPGSNPPNVDSSNPPTNAAPSLVSTDPKPDVKVGARASLTGTASVELEKATVIVLSKAGARTTYPASVAGMTFHAEDMVLRDGKNPIQVSLVGKNGKEKTFSSHLTADAMPPTLARSEPTAGSRVTGSFLFTGYASEALHSARINGKEAVVSGSQFTYRFERVTSDLELRIELYDRVKNPGEAHLSFPLHSAAAAAPVALVDYQPPLEQTVGRVVNLRGEFNTELKSLTVFNQPASISGKVFTVQLTLQRSGPQKLQATGETADGRLISETITLNADVDPPELDPASLSHRDGDQIRGESIRFRGTANENLHQALVNGEEAFLRDRVFEKELRVDATADRLDLEIILVDARYNRSQPYKLSLRRDVLGPSVVSMQPPFGADVRSTTLTIEGLADEDLAAARIDGKAGTVSGREFSFLVTDLTEGSNRYQIDLQDKDGNSRPYPYELLYRRPTTRQLAWAETVEELADPTLVPSAEQRNKLRQTGYPWKVRDRSSGVVLVLVTPGLLLQGTMAKTNLDEFPQRKVTISKPFYIGQLEVKRSEWFKVMKSKPWAGTTGFSDSMDVPATKISWHQVQEFLANTGLQLPTEAQWEHACRAGIEATYFFGDGGGALTEYAWFRDNRERGSREPQAVGLKKPNPWGLFDVLGNAAEYCADWYSNREYYTNFRTGVVDPRGPSKNAQITEKVTRGGGGSTNSAGCRSGARGNANPDSPGSYLGFRVVRPAE